MRFVAEVLAFGAKPYLTGASLLGIGQERLQASVVTRPMTDV